MNNKNHYITIFIIWCCSTLIHTVNCIVNFVNGELWEGFIFLVLAIAFALVAGMLLDRAIVTIKFNKLIEEMDKGLAKIIEEMQKKEGEEPPFEEFDVPFPEVKNKTEGEK